MDMRLTRDKMKTFDGHEKIGVLTVSAKLTEMGELQNAANEVLAANINDLIRRVCALEDKAERDDEILKKIAVELSGFKAVAVSHSDIGAEYPVELFYELLVLNR